MNKIKQKFSLSLIVPMVAFFPLVTFAQQTDSKMAQDGEIQFLEGDDVPVIVDPGGTEPLVPYPPGQPGTPGPLSIDFVSSFHFGSNEITAKDESYSALAQEVRDKEGHQSFMPNFMQVTDQRGTGFGWDVTVRQLDQLMSDADVEYPELTGSSLKLTNPLIKAKGSQTGQQVNKKAPTSTDEVIIQPQVETLILSAKEKAGLGTWSTQWGDTLIEEQDGNKDLVKKSTDIQLQVPGKTPKSATDYQATLVWTIKSHMGSVE